MDKNKKFKILEKIATADIAFEAYGKTLSELFESSALATTSVMVDVKDLKSEIKKDIKLQNEDIERLLFDFLNEIVFLKDAEMMLFKEFKADVKEKNKEFYLNAVLSGEKINPHKQNLKIDIKAITLHMFKVEKLNGRFKATVVLDI